MLGSALKQVRGKLGYSSARAFYRFLAAKSDLEFNYSYYMKIEADQVLPSAKVVSHLSQLLPERYGDHIVVAYCSSSFPKQAHLFPDVKVETVGEKSKKKTTEKAPRGKIAQKTLTERQVAALCVSKQHYFLFLMITLARRSVPRSELLPFFDGQSLDDAIHALVAVKVLFVEEGRLHSAFPEWAFPQANNESIKKLYRKLDEFDGAKTEFFKLNKVKSAEVFRRISPRYLDLLMQNVELLLQTLRLADDIDSAHNNEVISLSLKIHSGRIPG